MITAGLSAEAVLDPDTEVAFPESVVALFRGDIGQPHGGFPPALQKKVLGGAASLTTRPGASMAPVDLVKARAEVQGRMPRPISDFEFASWLMYPKVFTEYMADRMHYGNTSSLPTRAFFYGMEPGEEITVDLERGKHLIIRYVATSEGHDDGTRTVFFELNGQPRSVRVPDRSQVVKRPPRRQAEPDHPDQIGAPMPGTVATVTVIVGQTVARGDVLVTLEAMKMETSVRADRDGRIREVVARPGEHVEAKDLLLVLE